jgi:hypothetical protein
VCSEAPISQSKSPFEKTASGENELLQLLPFDHLVTLLATINHGSSV